MESVRNAPGVPGPSSSWNPSRNLGHLAKKHKEFPTDSGGPNRLSFIAQCPLLHSIGIVFGLAGGQRSGVGMGIKPLGIVKDQLEMRWTEPYWEYGDNWYLFSTLKLRSLQKIESEASSLLRIFQPIKRISLHKLVDEENFDNEPYVGNPSYGIHRLRPLNEK